MSRVPPSSISIKVALQRLHFPCIMPTALSAVRRSVIPLYVEVPSAAVSSSLLSRLNAISSAMKATLSSTSSVLGRTSDAIFFVLKVTWSKAAWLSVISSSFVHQW